MDGALSAVHMDVPIVDNNGRDPMQLDFKKWHGHLKGNKVARRLLLLFGSFQMKAAGRHATLVSRPQDKSKRQPPAGHENVSRPQGKAPRRLSYPELHQPCWQNINKSLSSSRHTTIRIPNQCNRVFDQHIRNI